MATIHNGILSGKLGPKIYFSRNGKQYVRSLPKKSNKPPTEMQKIQQLRFGMTIRFFSRLKTLIGKGYGTSACISYHVKNAICGEYPDLAIDYSKVVLTKGRLEGVSGPAVHNAGNGRVDFTWKDLKSFHCGPDDEAILVAYSPTWQQPALKTSVTRKSETASLEVFESSSGDTVHCWIAFISADGKLFSDSRYLGTVTML